MKKAVIIFLTAILMAGGMFFVWQNQNERANAAKIEAEILKGLTADEIGLILKSEAYLNRDAIIEFNKNAAKRQTFIKGMHEYLALAAQARREGFADDENFKINVEYKKNILLADLYTAKLSQGSDKLYVVPDEEIEKIWANAENEKLFDRDLNVLKEIRNEAIEVSGSQTTAPVLKGDALEKIRLKWARTKFLSEKAGSDAEFINQPEVSLRLKIVEAGILANDYLRQNWEKSIKATDGEIADYLAKHPEYDINKKKQLAETVLQKAKAGEDFASLAEKFSEDRATKDKGGLYTDMNKNVLWAEVERAALELEKGQIAEQIVESATGFHIVKLENKQISKTKDGNEAVKFSVRHILLQKSFEEPNNKIPGVPPPFMKGEEIAKAEVEKEKREKFIAEIFRQNPISMPEDFSVALPETENLQTADSKSAE
jgi:hypothetical protein